MKRIRDSVHDKYIQLNDEEISVVDHPLVQRLRRVQQLGLSNLIYPSATHTRFEHSLGVMHLAGEYAESLGLSDTDIEAYRMAGLLHDVGHPPFSHEIESLIERELGISHEQKSCEIVDTISELPVDEEYVKDIIRGESEFDVVSGEVDVDRIDYLLRDSSQTGIKHGQIDADTIITFATADNESIVFQSPALQAIENLFNARVSMNKSVYSHHVSNIASSMLEKSVDIFLDSSNHTVREVMNWDDYQLHTYLLDSENIASRRLYERITNRNLYKRALYLSDLSYPREELVRINNTISDPRYFEKEIAKEAGIEPEQVIIDPPQLPKEQESNVKILIDGEKQYLSEISPVVEQVKHSEWRNTTLGVYTPQQHVDNVESAARGILDIQKEK